MSETATDKVDMWIPTCASVFIVMGIMSLLHLVLQSSDYSAEPGWDEPNPGKCLDIFSQTLHVDFMQVQLPAGSAAHQSAGAAGQTGHTRVADIHRGPGQVPGHA